MTSFTQNFGETLTLILLCLFIFGDNYSDYLAKHKKVSATFIDAIQTATIFIGTINVGVTLYLTINYPQNFFNTMIFVAMVVMLLLTMHHAVTPNKK